MNRKLKKGEKAYTSMPIKIKGIDKENSKLTMVASTQDVDRHGDTVMQDGWDLGPFQENPVILNSHRHSDATEVIARAENVRIEGKGKRAKLIMDWVFAVEENPKAKVIFDLYAGGFLHASSVGFIARKFAENPDGSRNWYVIEQAELLEVSAVSVPANARALAKAKGIDVDMIKSEDDEEDEEIPEDDIDEDEVDETDEDADEATDEDEIEEPEADEIDDEDIDDVELDELDCDEDGKMLFRLSADKQKKYKQLERLEEMGAIVSIKDGIATVQKAVEVAPAPAQDEPKKPSYASKVSRAIQNIESKQREHYKKVAGILKSLLASDTEGVTMEKKVQEQVRKRKVNQAIRTLMKAK